MPKARSVHLRSMASLWPWVIGALLMGLVVCIVMPPLLIVLIVGIGAWCLMKKEQQTASSRRAIAVGLGLGMAAALFLIILIVGNVSR